METTATLAALDLEGLLAYRAEHCVSLFLPTQRIYDGTHQDPIRFGNLVREAEDRLEARGVPRDACDAILAPARRRLDDMDFWQHQDDGLALFLAPDTHRELRVPLALQELVVVGEWFELKPLLPLVVGDGRFFVLALSQGTHRLLQATRHAGSIVATPDAPASLEDAMRFDDPERQLQFHSGTGTPASQGRRAAMYHGQGVGTDDNRSELLRYCQQVDRGLRPVLAGETAPLVLVALPHEQAAFREANSFPHLLEAGVNRNPDDLADEALREMAWEVVAPVFQRALETALDRYRAQEGEGRTAHTLDDVLPAAWQGRVDTLFLERGRYLWGTYDAERAVVSLSTEADQRPGEWDLLDLAARCTLRYGGTVYVIDADRFPARAPVMALLRF